jgi:two-component system nitrate/nitrite response regulator NarL
VRRSYRFFEAAKRDGPRVTRRRLNVRMARIQQIQLAGRLQDCTDGRGRPAAKRPRLTPKTRRDASTPLVPRGMNKTPRQNSVVIADRNPVFLCGLATVLQSEGNFVVVASCRDEMECVASIRTHSPSLALLDMSLADLSGLHVLAVVRTEALPTRVVFLSSSATDAARAFSMGASGVLPKDGTPQSLIRWLRQIISGHQLVPIAVLDSRMRGAPNEPVVALTSRERQIIELVSTGLSNREVGRRLHISEGTIKVHLHHIFQKLSIRNRTALANIGMIRPESQLPQNT